MTFKSVKAIIFDAYGTLFDVHSVMDTCQRLFPEEGEKISQIWREKQLEYAYLRSLMGRYQPFSQVTREGLRFACKDLGLLLNQEYEDYLLEAYTSLKAYEEVANVLPDLVHNHLAILSNGSYDMLTPLVEGHQFDRYLDIISVDDVKQFKPTPAAYACVFDQFPVRREEVLFLSSNAWDISGANNFGFYTAWVNRQNKTMDQMRFAPDTVIRDLTELPSLVK